jgi:excinuclease ABC subunit A
MGRDESALDGRGDGRSPCRTSPCRLGELDSGLAPLLDVGLGYLQLDRPGATLSAGDRQRIELTSTVRASTTGMLYVLDEPSVGLHPSNVEGLRQTIAALAANGNSVVVVEHERDLITAADWIIELGPAAGAHGGTIIAEGTPGQLTADRRSIIGPFLAGTATVRRDHAAPPGPGSQIRIEVGDLYNLHGVTAAFPLHRLTALAGPSGAGKTALVLDSLVPAAQALLSELPLPRHVRTLDLGGIHQVVQIDASPIGQNARSTPATYSGAFDAIRRLYADSPAARRRKWKPGHFSFNTREGHCPTCRGPRRPRPRRAVPARHQRRVPDLSRRRPSAHNGTVLGVSGPLHRQPIPQALTTPYPKPSSGASLFRNLAVVAALTARLLLAPSVG